MCDTLGGEKFRLVLKVGGLVMGCTVWSKVRPRGHRELSEVRYVVSLRLALCDQYIAGFQWAHWSSVRNRCCPICKDIYGTRKWLFERVCDSQVPDST